MNINPVVHFEIYVDEMARAKAFYQQVLGITLTAIASPMPDVAMEMWFFPKAEGDPMASYGCGGALIKMDGFSANRSGTGTVVYFGCDDCAVPVARARPFGVEIVQDKASIGEYGFCALVKDTEGNLIGFHSMA